LTPDPARPCIAVPGVSAATYPNEEEDDTDDDEQDEQDEREVAVVAVGDSSQHQHWTITDDPGLAGSREVDHLGGSRTSPQTVFDSTQIDPGRQLAAGAARGCQRQPSPATPGWWVTRGAPPKTRQNPASCLLSILARRWPLAGTRPVAVTVGPMTAP
jgi:hypothetical protein